MLLNSTASWIWEHFADENAVEAYAEHFGVSRTQAEADIGYTLGSWESLTQEAGSQPFTGLVAPSTAGRGDAFYRIGSTLFEVQFDSESFVNEVTPRLAPVRVEVAHASGIEPSHDFVLAELGDIGYAVFRDGEVLVTAPLVTACRTVLLQELTRLAIPGRDFKLILHAGAVGNSDSCIILAGASYSGKSTLCAAVMQSGLLCYSDDSACLTEHFTVAGMPFAISLREGSWPLFPELNGPRFVGSNLNGSSPEAKAVGLIFVNYDPEAAATTLQPVSTFEALTRLNASGFWVEHTKEAITAFLNWLGCIPIRELRYSSLREAVLKVQECLG